jgi:predicted acylesterase/phospholipase RssA/ankyrin repeat protein
MPKFADLIKNIQTGNDTAAQVKIEIEKFAVEAKLPNLNAICLNLEEDGIGLIQYLVRHNEVKLLRTLLSLLDKNPAQEINHLLIEPILEAVKLNDVVTYQILAEFLGENLPLINQFIKENALRYSSYRFILQIFQQNMNDTSEEALLQIAQNKNDLAFLLKRFPPDLLYSARDVTNNNILHLALQTGNQNIVRYIVNHAGIQLLYQKNVNGVSPIDMVYADIVATAEKNRAPYNFTMLMLLDQVGADLETETYPNVRFAYQNMSEYHHRFMLAKQVKPSQEVHAVAFNGGGAKGQAFMAAYREALDHHIIKADKVKQYAGTSAGAITAGVFAMGFDINRCQAELNAFDFKQLMNFTTTAEIGSVKESYVKKWAEYYQQGAYYYLISDIVMTLASESMWRAGPVMKALQQLITSTTGIFKPTYLRETLERLVKERIAGSTLAHIDPSHITFKDLQDHPEIFKELTVYITNLTTGKTEKCSAETSPTMSVIDGIVCSASFPIFFEAAQKFEIITTAQGLRERNPVLIDGKPVFCCDGGVLKNDPVDAFDNGHFNEHALTFMLVSSDSKKQYESEGKEEYQAADSSLQVLSQLYKLSRSAERKNIHEDVRNHSRIIYIDTKKVGTLDFDHARENAPILEAAGQDAVIDYLHRRTANGYADLRPETIALLMSYHVAKFSTSGAGQVVEINPGKKLTPLQILRVYAAATEAEVYMLRSIINPNQRDERGVTAMAIAARFNFAETENRLRLAGGRPADEGIQLGVMPSYLQRGEAFLRTVVSDEDLLRIETLCTEKERLETEKQQLEIALLTQQQENALLRTRYNQIRRAPNMVRAIAALKTYKDTLVQEYHRELDQILGNGSNTIPANKEESMKFKSAKIAGIQEVLDNLGLDNENSAAEIVRIVKQKYPGFFGGVIRHRAKTLCHDVIATEEYISKAYGM